MSRIATQLFILPFSNIRFCAPRTEEAARNDASHCWWTQRGHKKGSRDAQYRPRGKRVTCVKGLMFSLLHFRGATECRAPHTHTHTLLTIPVLHLPFGSQRPCIYLFACFSAFGSALLSPSTCPRTRAARFSHIFLSFRFLIISLSVTLRTGASTQRQSC
jgi:hypothetical protein